MNDANEQRRKNPTNWNMPKKTKTPRNILEHAENKERNTLSVFYDRTKENTQYTEPICHGFSPWHNNHVLTSSKLPHGYTNY